MAKRGRRRRGGDDGAVLVEAVLVLPILLLLVFGILEFGLAFKNASTAAAASRSGARIGSSLPKSDLMPAEIVRAVNVAMEAGSSWTPIELRIFRARTDGTPDGACPSTTCIVVRPTSGSSTFSTNAATWQGSWTAASRRACLGASDSLGVQVEVRHDFITNLFGTGRTLNERTVMRLEPERIDLCGAT